MIINSSSITYRELTKREVDAYVDGLYSIRTEETKKQKVLSEAI
jgi:hypothetical protein